MPSSIIDIILADCIVTDGIEQIDKCVTNCSRPPTDNVDWAGWVCADEFNLDPRTLTII